MQALLEHPAVQGGLAPFVVALLVALFLRQWRLSGLALIAGFAVTVYLSGGFAFDPLTATRKIVVLGLLGAALGLLATSMRQRWWRPVLAILAAGGAVWMSLRILQQHDMAEALRWGAGGALYLAWLVYSLDGLHPSASRAGTAALALGMGTGAAALFASSALLGLYGLSLGAAAGALLLLAFLGKRELPLGRAFSLPLALLAGLVGWLAVLTAELPWLVLPALALIPLAAQLPLGAKLGVRVQIVLLALLTLACAAGAAYLSWRVNGALPV